MTQAEINILIRARAKEARIVLQAVSRDLAAISRMGASAGGVLDALGVASKGYAGGMKLASAAAADLARALALINKSGGAAAKNVMNFGVAVELALPATAGLSAAVMGLSRSMEALAGTSAMAATGLKGYTTAAKAATAASAAGAAGARKQGAATANSAAQLATLGNRTMATASSASSALGGMAAAAAAAGSATTRAAGGTSTLSTATGGLGDNAGRANRDWGRLNQTLYDSSDRMRRAGSQAQWTGRQLSLMFTAPALLAGGLAMKWELDYEKAMTRLRKVYDGNMQDLAAAGENNGPGFSGSKFDRFFVALSNKMGIAKEEIADIAADWAQAGATGASLAKAVQLTTEFMIVGDQDAAKSTQDLIAVQAQYKISTEDLKLAIMDLNAISNATPVSMADLTDGMTRTASVAREAGVDVRHLGAFIAALTPAAGTAAVTSNGLKSIFTRLLTPTKEAAQVLEQVGIVVSDPQWISKNAVERLAELSQKFSGLSQQQKFDLAKPFAGLYQINKFVALMDDLSSAQGNYQKALDATVTPSKSFATYQKELTMFLQSNPQKLKQAGTIIKNSLTDAIIPLIPHIVYLAQTIAKITQKFSELSPEAQKFILIAIGILAAVGPLAMLFGSFAILGGTLGKTFFYVGKALLWMGGGAIKAARNLAFLNFATMGGAAATGKKTPGIWATMMARIKLITAAGAVGVKGIWLKFGKWYTAATAAIGGAASAAWAAAMALWVRLTNIFGRRVATSTATTMGGVTGATAAGGAARNRVWVNSERVMHQITATGGAARVATERGTQLALTSTVAAGGAAQTQATRNGQAGMLAAAKRGRGGMLLGLVSIFALFPGTIWKYLKLAAEKIAQFFRSAKSIFTGGSSGWAKTVEDGLFRMLRPIAAWAGRAWRAITAVFSDLGPWIIRALSAIAPRLGAAVAAFFSGPIGWIAAAAATIAGIFLMLPDRIQKSIMRVLKVVGMQFATPFIIGGKLIGKAFTGIVDLVSRGMDALGKMMSQEKDNGVPLLARPFVVGVKIIGKTLALLPQIVVKVFRAVVDTIAAAGRAVYKAFSYINPFAHHSPSLVENVTGGMAIVKNEFSEMATAVALDTKRAYDSISKFGQVTSNLKIKATDIEREEKRDKIAKNAPEALSAYDGLEAELPMLKASLAKVDAAIKAQEAVIKSYEDRIKQADKAIEGMNDTLDVLKKAAEDASTALDSAKAALETYSTATLTGTRAMSDAIFENEMAQKRLRLEIMRLEEAGGSVEDLTDKFAKLQGEIENLTSQREELRLGGAGSDILGTYDKMIDDLKAQQGATASAQVSPIAKAQKELEELQRKGEKLDLENSLKFDPLNRQIQQMLDTTQEMDFATITTGIRTNQAAVTALTAVYDSANSAVQKQEDAIASATKARDAMSEGMELEKDKLDGLNESSRQLEEAISAVEAAMSDIISWTDTVTEKVEKLKQAADEAASAADDMAAAWDAAGEGDFEVPGGTLDGLMDDTDIDAMTEELTKQLGEMFGDIDIGGAIGRFFGRIGNWFKELPGKVGGWFADVGTTIWEKMVEWGKSMGNWFSELPGKIGGWFSDVGKKIGEKVGEWAGSVGSWFSGLGTAIGDWFSRMWDDHVWPFLSQMPGKIVTFINELPGHIIDAISYIAGYLVGLVVAAVVGAFTGITKIGSLIIGYFQNDFLADVDAVWDSIYGWLRGLWDKVWEFVTVDVKNFGLKIYNYFADGSFLADVDKVWDSVYGWLRGLWDKVWEFVTVDVKNFGLKIMTYFSDGSFLSDVAAVWDSFYGWLRGLWDGVWEFVTNEIPEFGRKIVSYFQNDFLGDVDAVWDTIWEFGKNIVNGIKDGIVAAWNGAYEWVKTHVVDPFVNGFKDALGIHSPSTVFADFGKNIIEGLWNGIVGMGTWIKDKVVGLAKDYVVNPVKEFLGINSPSRLFAEIGSGIGEGLVKGIDSGQSDVAAAALALAGSTLTDVPAMTGPLMATPAVPTEALDPVQAAYDTTFAAIRDTSLASLNTLYTTAQLSTDTWGLNTNASLTATETTALAGVTAWGNAFSGQTDSLESRATADINGLAANVTATLQNGVVEWTKLGETLNLSLSESFATMARNFAATMADSIRPVFDSFTPMLKALEESFANTVANVGTIWDGIKEKTAAPARFVINDVYNDGIRGAWNNFNEFLDLPPLREQIAKFATGGDVRGKGTGTSDSIPALLSNGEHVITAQEVRGAGGHAAIEETRKFWREGKVGAFARGGPVDVAAPAWAGGGGEANLQPAAILARRNVHMYWPEIQTIGGYRANDPYPDHPSGLALDIMTGDPVGTQVNNWLHEQMGALGLNYTIWKQFYKPAGGVGNMMEDRGSPTQNHMDHVHALFNANGVPGIQAGGVGSNGAPAIPMDQIVRDAINAKMDAIRDRAPSFGGGIGEWIPKSIEKGRGMLLDKMVPLAAAATQAMSAAGSTGNVESWRPMAMEAMRRNGFNADDPRQVDAMLRQIASESSGNPRAIQQIIDVNSGGNEAGGLLQIAKGTWPGVRDPSLVDDRFDPWANMNGALRYYRREYGGDLTTNWGHGHGYDAGGLLPPTPDGFGTYYNHTGKPEMVLTNSDWDAIYEAANNPVDASMISDGMIQAIDDVFGINALDSISSSMEDAVTGANEAWVPLILGQSNATADAAKAAASAAKATSSGVDRFTEVGQQISKQVQAFGVLATAIATAASSETQDFNTWVPVINALAGMIEGLPDAEAPTYVDWAGTGATVTEEMRQQKAANDARNFAKGTYGLVKTMAPLLLKHTASIGSALTTIIAQDGAMWGTAIGAIMTGNPMGAIIAIPTILKNIFTMLPLVINAIVEIVPALIKAILKFIQSFMPNSTFAYDSIEAAQDAVIKNESALKQGATAPNFVIPKSNSTQSAQTNEQININIYGDLSMPNITNGNDGDALLSNLKLLSEKK